MKKFLTMYEVFCNIYIRYSNRRNFKDSLIILSVGPYSAVQAAKLGLSDDEWISLSDKIRRYHECTHFVCRSV
ncbi:MAG: hypothetical protein IJT37_00180 [Lachnospiraceae bacterium]|nr:hypothetical protein [Lachnospiraceae bacterium]